jgi:hypothetical protein
VQLEASRERSQAASSIELSLPCRFRLHRSLIVARPPAETFLLQGTDTMKSVVFASVLAGAAAFAPASQKASSSALKMGYENEFGVIAPTQFFGTSGSCNSPVSLALNISLITGIRFLF